MGRSCPSGCPEDLDGNSIVDDADLLIVLFNSGAQGAPAFAGQVQSPQGAFTVSLTLRSSLGRWLRTEGKLLTEVPWIFAVPTGANKVTVYWDGVPGATGYRVRCWKRYYSAHQNP